MADYSRVSRAEDEYAVDQSSVPLRAYDGPRHMGSQSSLGGMNPLTSPEVYHDQTTPDWQRGSYGSPEFTTGAPNYLGDLGYASPQTDYGFSGVRAAPAFRSENSFTSQDFGAKQNRHFSVDTLTSLGPEHPPVYAGLSRPFKPGRQLLKLLLAGLLKWLVTAGLVAALYGMLFHFANKKVMSKASTNWFDTWNTVISIMLGLNIASALKGMALDMRWWILSKRKRPLREVDLILHCDSMTELLKLAWVSRRFTVNVVCLLWLLWNIIAQIGVACVQLTYSTNPTTSHAILTPNSEIWIPDVSAFYPTDDDPFPSLFVQQATANTFGQISTSYPTTDISKAPQTNTTYASVSADFFYNPSTTGWRYTFYDTPPITNYNGTPSDLVDISIASDRTIDTVGTCEASAMEVNSTGYWYFQSTNEPIGMYPPYLTLATTFMVDYTYCGDNNNRTARVEAFETGNSNPDNGPESGFWYYNCCITVTEIANARNEQQSMPANLSFVAANAIGLQGFHDHDFTNQYRIYQNETHWGRPLGGNATAMGTLISQFSAGVVAAAGHNNPFIRAVGVAPSQGVALEVSDAMILALLVGLIAGLHLVCYLGAAVMANKVVVVDQSALSMAKLLGPTVRGLGNRGGLLDGKALAKVLDKQVVYGVVSGEGATGVRHRLCLEDMRDNPEMRKVRAFPQGMYV